MVDLKSHEQASIAGDDSSHVLARPWWKNIEIYGFGAAGYYNTGSAGTRDVGSFEIREATIFVEAEVWENASFMLELQTNRLGKDNDLFTRTGEVYLHFRDIGIADSAFGLKIGRVDIPFGEEYLRQDAVDNPLITHSAAYPYGFDEGVLVYSSFLGANWIAAITDGSDTRSLDDHSDKALNFKVSGNVLESLYLSASFMSNGTALKSAMEFGGSHFEPVGNDYTGRGVSSAAGVNSRLVEFDAIQQFSEGDFSGELWLSLGAASQNDDDDRFDRDLRWFAIQPFLQLNPNWYMVIRYSEIGTYDNAQGYHFDGKTFAGGNNAFGFAVRRFGRLGFSLGWTPNPHVTAKVEIGRDWFKLIDDAALLANNDGRSFFGLEVVVSFN